MAIEYVIINGLYKGLKGSAQTIRGQSPLKGSSKKIGVYPRLSKSPDMGYISRPWVLDAP